MYVDDPLVLARGNPALRRLIFFKVIATWMSLGHSLAWHKSQMGPQFTWMSIVMAIASKAISATIRKELLDDI